MKPIIIDMKDMSDSTEVYESRPNPVLTGFIYVILTMFIIAFIWMGFSKVDIVVKGTGTVAASKEVATVTNQVAGVITGRNIKDGQKVKKGDILYTISHEEQALQLESLKQQLEEYTDKEEMLKAYENWLESGTEFGEELADNLYYNEMVFRKQLVELGRESTLQAYTEELAAYQGKIGSNTDMMAYYSDAITKSEQLIEAMRNRKNNFNNDESYYQNMMENYLVQYQLTMDQYNDKIKELQKQSDAAAEEIKELEALKNDLQGQLNSEETPVSVSVGDVSGQSGVEQQLQELETALDTQKDIKESADSQISQYQIQRNTALASYEKESIAAVESNILNYKQNMAAYGGTQKEYVNGQNLLKEQGTEVKLGNLVIQEKYNTAEELEACRQSRSQLVTQIDGLEQNIRQATVKASIDGTINLSADLVEGDYLGAGIQVLSIIPDTQEGSYLVKSYIENKDIAKIGEGMKVTYEIGAYPSREYGTMTGEVTFVSADLKVNNNGSAYYMVETSVKQEELRNCMGEEAALKVGMLCETKIVIEEKSVLEVLVDKLFHMSN